MGETDNLGASGGEDGDNDDGGDGDGHDEDGHDDHETDCIKCQASRSLPPPPSQSHPTSHRESPREILLRRDCMIC